MFYPDNVGITNRHQTLMDGQFNLVLVGKAFLISAVLHTNLVDMPISIPLCFNQYHTELLMTS